VYFASWSGFDGDFLLRDACVTLPSTDLFDVPYGFLFFQG
jgi:GH18 family chitinase